jgi:TetR/AcrR family transcriptional regulator, fatty acid metabolism regulator protein
MVYRTTTKMADRKAARRRKLVEAATKVFGEHGYHATTVPMIVATSETSTGSFYFYFRSKEDVFAAVIEELGREIAVVLTRATETAPAGLPQMIAAVVHLFVFLAENAGKARILIVESSGLGSRLEQIRRNIVASHARSVEQALASLAPVIIVPERSVASRCWLGAVYESAYHWLELPAEHRPDVRSMACAVADFVIRGIGADPTLVSGNGFNAFADRR